MLFNREGPFSVGLRETLDIIRSVGVISIKNRILYKSL
jgi:hypothetical protein